MLKKRIIPVLLINSNSLVKTVNFKNPRVVGDIISAVKVFDKRKADELIILDIGKKYSNKISKSLVKEISKYCFMPLSFGGGIRSISDAHFFFENGADKIVINSVYYNNKKLLEKIVRVFGSQAIIFSLDYLFDKKTNSYFCFSNNKVLKQDPIYVAKQAEKMGVGEILFNDVDKDGMMNGYNCNYLDILSNSVNINTIAIGGCGSKSDFYDLSNTNISAYAASSIFFWVGESIISIKEFLYKKKINVRKI